MQLQPEVEEEEAKEREGLWLTMGVAALRVLEHRYGEVTDGL